MDEQQALDYFWNQFAPAYEENSVPDEETMKELHPNGQVYPYITYQKIIGSLDEPVYPTASIWTRSDSWTEADEIVNSINADLDHGGVIIKIEGGRMWIVRGNPFAQAMSDTDKTIRRYFVNIAVEFFTE